MEPNESVSVVTGYALDDIGSIPNRNKYYSPHHGIQIGSEVRPAF
jgi:hypothetical protein